MRRVLAVLVMAAALVGGLLPAAPALAACPAPGGVGIPAADPAAGDFALLGRGWGHGVGMSQHGAQGAALLGCDAIEILSAYYPGTAVAPRDLDGDVIVGLFPNTGDPEDRGANRLNVRARTDLVPWQLLEPQPGGGVVVVDLPDQPQDRLWQVRVDEGGYVIDDVTDGPPFRVWDGGTQFDTVQVVLDGDHLVELPAKDDRPYRRGRLGVQATGSEPLAPMRVTVALPSMDSYLYGLAEVPFSWPGAALQSQVITGRSYAAAAVERGEKPNCGCHLWDSASDQVYRGYEREGDPSVGQRWVDAVNATSGLVLTYRGDLAIGYYSSTHGGQSEALEFSGFFPGSVSFPYLVPVDDSRWETASDSATNGVRTWSEAFSAEAIGAAFGVGVAQVVRTPEPRGAGGRVGVPARGFGGVEIIGTRDTVTVSGLEFVNTLGVRRRSERFEVVQGAVIACAPTTDQSDNTLVTRSFGPGRIDTAVAVSGDHWESASDVVLATAGDFADALSAGALAASLDAPLLLTTGNALSPAVAGELARLEPSTVHVMGGPAAISTAVTDRLTADGYTVRRVAGTTRFETARAAALAAGPSPSGDVAVALGEDWPDAVSAGALAASADQVPTLLTTRESLPATTLQGLADLGARRVLLIGGTAAIAGSVTEQVTEAGYAVARLSGSGRLDTSIAVARDGLSRGEPGDRPVILASAGDFPDALAAGALAARREGALLLVSKCDLGDAPQTSAYLDGAGFGGATIVGGTSAVSDLVREQVTVLLR